MGGGRHASGPDTHTRVRLVIVVAVLCLALLAGGLILVTRSHAAPASAAPTSPPTALTVSSTSPSGTSVAGGSTIAVQFSTSLAQGSPMPTLSPAIPGAWTALSPSLIQYQATGPLVPGATETITVPGGTTGVVGARGQHLPATVTSSFTVAPGSVLRLQQLLAELGYLPLSFTAASPVTSPTQETNVQVGTFNWRWANQPASLTSLWTAGSSNVITQGAVMNFEAQHNLTTDGEAGPEVWADLLAAVSSGQDNALPYGYVYVSKILPETVTVYQNGAEVYSTLANTGAATVATPDGTWPVYEHLTSTTMKGTNPDGSTYDDPNIPWVSYFTGGDALHGYVRASYGFPQSDGCVEMPVANAAIVFPDTPLGTLVTVS